MSADPESPLPKVEMKPDNEYLTAEYGVPSTEYGVPSTEY